MVQHGANPQLESMSRQLCTPLFSPSFSMMSGPAPPSFGDHPRVTAAKGRFEYVKKVLPLAHLPFIHMFAAISL